MILRRRRHTEREKTTQKFSFSEFTEMPFNDKRKNAEEEEYASSNRASSFVSSVFRDDELKKTNFKTSLTLVVDDSQTTNRKQKERPTRADYSLLLSGLYALVLILIGLLFPLSDALQNKWLVTEFVAVFLVYIYVISTVFLIYVQGHIWYNAYKAHHGGNSHGHQSSISSHSSSSSSAAKRNSSSSNAALTVTPPHGPGDADKARRNRAKHRSMTALVRYSSSVNLGSKEAERDFGDNDYGQKSFGEEVDEEFEMWIDMTKLGGIFSHEGSSFYLRLGALFFGIGHLIYVCLELENNTHIPASCGINIFWWTYIIRLIFISVQTFFLFKNQSVHITKMKILARFGFAHLIATNFCIWLRTLINEISHEYHHLIEGSHAADAVANYSTSPAAPAAHLLPIHSIAKRATADGCSYYRGILQSAAIYLFPFVLEYSLIAMGMFAIIYYSIDEHSKGDVIKGLANFFKVQRMDLSGVEKVEGHHHGDEGHGGHHGPSLFQKSHNGMFAGILLLAACIVSIIIFFFTMNTQQDFVTAELIYLTSDLVLHSLLLVASIAAIVQVNRLSYIAKPVSIDDMLLYLSMSGTLILEIAITIAAGNRLSPGGGSIASPALKSNEVLRLCSSMVAAIQTIAQVIVAMSGMRRYPSKASHLSDMPGRNFVTFLVVGNVSVWIFRTLQAKQLSLHNTQIEFYGGLAWLLLMNINLPLLLFYRFHSSICLADVWMVAYEPLHQKVQKPSPEHGTPQSSSIPVGDFPSNSIIRSVSVPQLYRQASSGGGGRRAGNGAESNGRAVFDLDGISRTNSVSSLNIAHRF